MKNKCNTKVQIEIVIKNRFVSVRIYCLSQGNSRLNIRREGLLSCPAFNILGIKVACSIKSFLFWRGEEKIFISRQQNNKFYVNCYLFKLLTIICFKGGLAVISLDVCLEKKERCSFI